MKPYQALMALSLAKGAALLWIGAALTQGLDAWHLPAAIWLLVLAMFLDWKVGEWREAEQRALQTGGTSTWHA